MSKLGTAQVRTAKEELGARTRSTSSTICHSSHSMVVSERAHAARLANACSAPQRASSRMEYSDVIHLPRYHLHRPRSSPCFTFDDLFVKKIILDVIPPSSPRRIIPLTEQRFMKAEQCFDLKESDEDDESLFYKTSLRGK